jgi:hypothetical protein
MPNPRSYVSCLIRIWHSQAQENPELPPSVQIEVENIQSGRNHQFDTLDELFRYLEGRVFRGSDDLEAIQCD